MCIGKTVSSVHIFDSKVKITFTDSTAIVISNSGKGAEVAIFDASLPEEKKVNYMRVHHFQNLIDFPLSIGDTIVSQPIPCRYTSYQDRPTDISFIEYNVIHVDRSHLPITISVTVEHNQGLKPRRETISISNLFELNNNSVTIIPLLDKQAIRIERDKDLKFVATYSI
jgi:hypothetical protein